MRCSLAIVFGLDCTKKQHAKLFRDRRQNMFVCRGEVVEGVGINECGGNQFVPINGGEKK